MPEKPRVKAPTKRTTVDPEASARKRRMLLVVGGAGIVLIAVGALVGVLGILGGGVGGESVRAGLVAAAYTLQVEPAGPAEHSVTDPSGTFDKWNTDPPTNGPHYGEAAIFGAYREPLEQARVVHNLEHGGVLLQAGEAVLEP